MPPSDVRLRRDLECPIMSCASDAEIAADHGTTPRYVRQLRDQMERDVLSAEVVSYAREIARLTGSAMPLGAIVRRAMKAALRTTQKAQQASEELSSTTVDRRPSSGDVRRPRTRHAGNGDKIAAVSGNTKSVPMLPGSHTGRAAAAEQGGPGERTRPRRRVGQRVMSGS